MFLITSSDVWPSTIYIYNIYIITNLVIISRYNNIIILRMRVYIDRERERKIEREREKEREREYMNMFININ